MDDGFEQHIRKERSRTHFFGFGVDDDSRFRVLPDRVQRISLARWAEGFDDPSPMFTGDATRPSTLVARWPTDARGRIERDRLAEVRVLSWSFDPQTFRALRDWHEEFHLGRHDLLVGSFGLRPCPNSLLRGAATSPTELGRHVATVLKGELETQLLRESA